MTSNVFNINSFLQKKNTIWWWLTDAATFVLWVGRDGRWKMYPLALEITAKGLEMTVYFFSNTVHWIIKVFFFCCFREDGARSGTSRPFPLLSPHIPKCLLPSPGTHSPQTTGIPSASPSMDLPSEQSLLLINQPRLLRQLALTKPCPAFPSPDLNHSSRPLRPSSWAGLSRWGGSRCGLLEARWSYGTFPKLKCSKSS